MNPLSIASCMDMRPPVTRLFNLLVSGSTSPAMTISLRVTPGMAEATMQPLSIAVSKSINLPDSGSTNFPCIQSTSPSSTALSIVIPLPDLGSMIIVCFGSMMSRCTASASVITSPVVLSVTFPVLGSRMPCFMASSKSSPSDFSSDFARSSMFMIKL